MRQDLDLQQEQPLTTYGTTQSPKKRIVRLRCPAFTSEEWRAKNPLLQKGEIAVESDTYSVKVGDGVSRWLGLPYISSAGNTAWGNIGGDINNQLDLTNALSTKANTADVQAMVDEAVGDITFDVFSVGQEGLVPAPTASDATKCLLGDGSWGTPGDIGGDSLPDQTDNAGKFLMTDGENASWGEALTNLAGNNDSLWLGSGTLGDNLNDAIVLYIGSGFVSAGKRAIAIGTGRATGRYSVCINGFDSAGDYAIQLGGNTASNPDSNTFKVGNANGNFEMMDANGKVPLDRLTYVTDQIGDISTALTSILGE